MANRVDIGLTEDGDLQLSTKDGMVDMSPIAGAYMVRQNVMARLKTQNPDWYVFPDIGADLEEFIGWPNTQETSEEIVSRIRTVLVRDGLVSYAELDIYPVPVNLNEVIFYVIITKQDREPIILNIPFDLNEGLKEIIA